MPDYLIAYDITCPRRLARMHRRLASVATPLQYSVFLLSCDRRAIAGHLVEAASLIEPDQDDLRCYPLPENGLAYRLGAPALPPGIHWSGLPAGWMEL